MNKSVEKYLNAHKGECRHDRYRSIHYNQLSKLSKKTVWHGKIIQRCEDCGADISPYRLVSVKTKDEYMDSLKYG